VSRAFVPTSVALALALAFARSAVAQPGLMSPGDLHQVHASIEGDDNCSKCHQSGKQVVSQLCLDCHKDLASELAASSGLHGRQYKGKGCEQCHVEHLGRKTKLIRWPGGAMEKLDHALTGYSLEGDHAAVKCLACHKKTSPLGRPQFLGTSTACASCHQDPHDGSFGADCRSCHDLADWKAFDQKAFDHDLARYPLTGKHQTVACDKCHGSPAKWKPLSFSTCDSCHTDPHQGEFAKQACTACHETGGWQTAAEKMRENHPRLSLKNGHRKVKCETCHDRGTTKAPSKGGDCVDCHAAVHEAKFGNRCEGCHKAIKWVGLPEDIGRDNHGKTSYPLAGKHTGVACAGCHPKSKPPAQRYRALVFDRCGGCHADKHAGEFAARAGGECGDCHTVSGFAPTTFGLDLHATTKFALDGRHVAVACSGCHASARPRLDFRVAKQACADCHANPHGDQFAAEMSGGGCATCHATTDWHQPRIDHSTWPLTGAHARTVCAACHGETERGAEPAAYRGIPRECEGCHEDIHAGQFRASKPERGCADCHDTTSYKLPAFEHAAKTTYPLDGKHAGVACVKCHAPTELRNGETAVRYRLGYRKCKDCHANPHPEGRR
jgi:hypothetical protein